MLKLSLSCLAIGFNPLPEIVPTQILNISEILSIDLTLTDTVQLFQWKQNYFRHDGGSSDRLRSVLQKSSKIIKTL